MEIFKRSIGGDAARAKLAACYAGAKAARTDFSQAALERDLIGAANQAPAHVEGEVDNG